MRNLFFPPLLIILGVLLNRYLPPLPMTVGVSCFVVGVVCLVVGVVWLVEGMACCVVGVACLVVGVASFTVEVVCLVGEHTILQSGSEVRTLSGVVSLIFRLFSGVSSL